jgi:two-component system sensor histidine kinase KdpD
MTPTNLVMFYLLAVVISARRWGLGAAVVTSVVGVAAFDFFFVPPHLSFTVANAEYILTFAALLAVALVIGTLTGQLRDHAAALNLREQETAALYAFTQRMVMARGLPEIAEAVVSQIHATFGRPATLEVPDAQTSLSFGAPLSPPERAAANCLSLRTSRGVVGTLLVQRPPDAAELDSAQLRVLDAFAAQAAAAMERAHLSQQAHQAEMLMEAERLHAALLHSISHGLRTPLATIIGSVSTVLESEPEEIDAETRAELLQTAREEADRLNRLVGNLLDMTRLESGHLKLLVDRYELADVVGAALGQAGPKLHDRPVRVDLPPDLPLVPLDQVLMVQVLDNLLDNADKYSPPGLPIEIAGRQAGGQVELTVADRGAGIPAGERERVFDKFYRISKAGGPSGTGLGLAICKGIVEAHHGSICAGARAGGGTVITLRLPLTAGGEGNA